MIGKVRETHARYLCDSKVAIEYLNAALEEGDRAVILMAMRNIAAAQEGGITGLSERTRLGRESMYKMLSENGNPKLSSFTRLLAGLGLHLKVEA
jgi:probable addiction module antidote protein